MRNLIWILTLSAAILGTAGTTRDKSNGHYYTLPSLRTQAALKDSWTASRIESIPALLRKHNVGAWLMSQKEYAEDTVFWSLKSNTQFSARRRTLSLYLANSTQGKPSSYTWIDNTPSVWDELREVLKAEDPATIALNTDVDVAFSSGLHAGEFGKVTEELAEWKAKFVNVPLLAVEFVGTMPPAQLDWYRKLQGTAWAIISEGFSEKVITPGTTTTEDVEWWFRERIQSMNYTTWFHPAVQVVLPKLQDLEPGSGGRTIKHGDMLHVDFGVTAMGMNTDTQHLAYVLYPGEGAADVPKGLLKGLKTVNKLQDIVKGNMKVGKSGNWVLRTALQEMKDNGIEGRIYSHPIGDWGHSAGTLIGMTNLQDGVPILGDLPLLKQTYYSVELYASSFVLEYNTTSEFYQEEDVYWAGVDEDGKDIWEWVWGRQEEFHLVRSEKEKNRTEDEDVVVFNVQE